MTEDPTLFRQGGPEVIGGGQAASDEFMDVSLNQWLRRVPIEMLKAHLNIDKQTAMKIPAEKVELV